MFFTLDIERIRCYTILNSWKRISSHDYWYLLHRQADCFHLNLLDFKVHFTLLSIDRRIVLAFNWYQLLIRPFALDSKGIRVSAKVKLALVEDWSRVKFVWGTCVISFSNNCFFAYCYFFQSLIWFKHTFVFFSWLKLSTSAIFHSVLIHLALTIVIASVWLTQIGVFLK